MNNIVSIIRSVFITMVVSLFIFIWWGFYKEGSLGFGGTTPPREDRPSMKEVTLLLNDVTKGLPAAERNTERSKPEVRSAIKEYRDPTQKTFDQLMQNVSDQDIWTKNNLKEYGEYDYCYGKYRLVINHEINDYTTIGKGISNLLTVEVSWTASSPCRKAYLERSNTKMS